MYGLSHKHTVIQPCCQERVPKGWNVGQEKIRHFAYQPIL
jgi:hypothetical protein